MILGVGLDLAATGPWAEALAAPSDAALAACFTPGERARVRGGAVDPAERLAARWAAKEACMKALGLAVPPLDVEVDSEPSGRPVLILHRQARAQAEAMGVTQAWLSLSHEGAVCAAVVVLEGSLPDGQRLDRQ